MNRSRTFVTLALNRARATSDQLVWILSLYGIPIVLGLISLWGMINWENAYDAAPEKEVEVRALRDTEASLSPLTAAEMLPSQPSQRYFNTNLFEGPVWFSLALTDTDASPKIIEFPSGRATEMACWNSGNSDFLGKSDGIHRQGAVYPVKTGFALQISPGLAGVVCKTKFVGPARLSADQWNSDQLETSSRGYHRRSGLIEGGLLVLAIFVLFTALINRHSLYVVFAVWLILTLRLSSIAGGWDEQWLNHALPDTWVPITRLLTRPLWALLTVSLFKTLFKQDLEKVGHTGSVTLSQILCLSLIVASLFLPRRIYYPSLWTVGGIALIIMSVSLAKIAITTRSRTSFWYAASFTVTMLSTLSEIFATAFSPRGLIGSANTMSAGLSALLASLAIAERMRQEHQQLLAAQTELQHTFDAVPVGLFTLDPEGRFMSANPAMREQLGNPYTTAEGRLWSDCFPPESWAQMQESLRAEEPIDIEIYEYVVPEATEPRSFVVRATLSEGKIEGSLQDVTEKVRAANHLEYLANFDSLTRSLNRRGIETAFKSALAQLEAGSPLAVAYLDLDRFKLINDLYGRNAGDDVLQHVCSRVLNVLPKSASLGRLGGDEFLLLLPDLSIDAAAGICRRVIETLGLRPYSIADKAFHVRGSIGLIDVMAGTSIKDAISVANRACRQAKAGGGEGLVIYEKNTKAFQDYEAEITLVELLATPEATEQLHLVMQPIMSLALPYDSLNFEVLLRMKDLKGNPIRTDYLIKAAESSGRMSAIDRWVLSTTLNWLNEHYQELKHTKFICMNLNGASLNDERFLDDVVSMLAANHHVAHHLCYEITESVALQDLANTQRFINKVRSFGAKVALDDFGAGYTSFSYLKDLPADLLKIDGSFIVNMNMHPANIAIVEAIVSLAGNLGMKTIAEWAEDVATVQTLRDIGVDYVQGYVVAKPQDPETILGATSSASFIRNDQLTQIINHFGKSESSVLQVDLFDPPNTKH